MTDDSGVIFHEGLFSKLISAYYRREATEADRLHTLHEVRYGC